MLRRVFYVILLLNNYDLVRGRGIMILYRPNDATMDCATSKKLRYDLSFGMGLSDTITAVFRTLTDADYECEVDIVTEPAHSLIVVLRFPTTIGYNCEYNPGAFKVLKMSDVYPICTEEHLSYQDRSSNFFLIYTKGRFRFLFRSNSSINNDMNAQVYEVTVTTARVRHENASCFANETDCFSPKNKEYYCMTNGVVCDGIKNCGITDWYDERKSECNLPVDILGYRPILAVLSIIFCAWVAAVHTLRRCLPKSTSFFVYDTSDDNEFRIDCQWTVESDRMYQPYDQGRRRTSLIPISSQESSSSESFEVTEYIEGAQVADVL